MLSSEDQAIKRVVKRCESMYEVRRDFRRRGKRLRRWQSAWNPKRSSVSDDDVGQEAAVSRWRSQRKPNASHNGSVADATNSNAESDSDEYQGKLADAMVMNSQLEEANARLSYQIEDLKDRVVEFEDLLCDQREALQRKSKDVMEAKYEIRVLRDKLVLSNELDEGSAKNLIMSNGRPQGNLVLHDDCSQHTELQSPGDSVVLEQLSRLNNEMQRALNQCEAVEIEMTALMEENLVLRRDRDAAVEMARSLLSQVRTAEVERSKSMETMKELEQQFEDMRKANEKLKEELAQKQTVCLDVSVNTDLPAVYASNDLLPAEADDNSDTAYTEDDLNEAFDTLDEGSTESTEQMDQQKFPVRADETSEEAMVRPVEETGTENQTSSVAETGSRLMSINPWTNVQLESVENAAECEASVSEKSPVVTEILPALVHQAEDIKCANGDAPSVQSEQRLPDQGTNVPTNELVETDDETNASLRTGDLPPMSLSPSTVGTSTNESYKQWEVISVRNPELLGAKRTLQRMDTAPVEWVGPLPSNITLKSLHGMKTSMSAVQYWLASAFVMFTSMSGVRFREKQRTSLDEDFTDGGREPSRSSISEASLNFSWKKETGPVDSVVLARVVKDVMTEHAGSLSSDHSFISVSWPDGAVEDSSSCEINYMAIQGADVIASADGNVLLSPVVYISSPRGEYRESLVVEIPHCALVDLGGWNVTLLQNKSLLSQEPEWKSMAMWRWQHVESSGNNDCHLRSESFQVSTNQPAAFALIGRAAVIGGCETVPMKRVSLAAFYSVRSHHEDPSTKIIHLKVLCTSDLLECQKAAELIESEDYHYPCSPWSSLVVSGNGSNLRLKLNGIAALYRFIGDSSKLIPFDEFWFGSGASSVSFTLVVEEPGIDEISVCLIGGQIGEKGGHDEQHILATVGLQSDDALPYRSHVTSPWRILLPYDVANKLAQLLDPDELRGNDWRHVAHVLGLGASEKREMERLARPTHYILSRLPALDDNRNTLQGLFDALFRTERSDAVEVITDWLSDV